MDVLEDLLLKSIESQKRFTEIVYTSMSFDYVKALEDYANHLGKDYDELTKEERQQAVLNAVLKEHDER